MTADLLSLDARTKREALASLGHDAPACHALRQFLFSEPNAELRALAARGLGESGFGGAGEWLRAALADPMPMVREACVRALAQIGYVDAASAISELANADPVWWVRRSSVYALGVFGGDDVRARVGRALSDPFWRVRHAAVQVLGLLGASPALRAELSSVSPESPALEFLLGGEPRAYEAAPSPLPAPLPGPLRDPDPAVVASRLAHADVSPSSLVELLADPHEALRALAAARIAAEGDDEALDRATRWLEEPRVPYAADAVRRMLDGLGQRAVAVAERALLRGGDGAAAWAIGWVVATEHDALEPLARAFVRSNKRALKRAAIPLATVDDLVALLGDDAVAGDAVCALASRGTVAARRALQRVVYASVPPPARAALVANAIRIGEHAVLEEALGDAHPTPRAMALRALHAAGELDAERATAAAEDADPWIRCAVLDAERAESSVLFDPDPWVRREAMGALPHVLSPRTVNALLQAEDPWLRAEACARVHESDDACVAGLLACARDREESVRIAAVEAIERVGTARLGGLLAGDALPEGARAAAHAALLRRMDDETARRAIAETLASGREGAQVRTQLEAVASFLDGASAPEITAPPPLSEHVQDAPSSTSPSTPRRELGRTGMQVGPLAISGAFELPIASLRRAQASGVDLFFWEPEYANLTQFLRGGRHGRDGRSARVIAGTYHDAGDAAALVADVDRALHRLRRDTIDVWLLFWSRSPSRLSGAAFEALTRLKESGKIGAVGFSTHDRDLAVSAFGEHAWDVAMVRHSAAHPGAEAALLPEARARGVGVVTFSALSYGRLLAPAHPGGFAPTAADCYRYSLAQPGVSACISAPRTHRELVENLAVIERPELDAATTEALRAHGVYTREANRRWNDLVRRPSGNARDAALAALAFLEGERERGATQTEGRRDPRPRMPRPLVRGRAR